MDKIRGLKLGSNGKPALGDFGSLKTFEDVVLCRRGDRFPGTFYLAEHHLIFSWSQHQGGSSKPRLRQIWISHPMISHCTFRPMPAVLRQRSALRLRCRDFTFVAFQFADEDIAREAYDMLKTLTCQVGDLTKLHALSYKPPPEEARCNGWEVYDARREFRRMGIGPKEADKGWRVSDINHDYSYSPTYPSVLVVPSSISDNVLKHGGVYRSKARIPALSYLHPVNNCSITRSSQPMVGLLKGKRNPQDEKLVAAIFSNSNSKSNGSSSDSLSVPAVDDGGERLSMQISRTTDVALTNQENISDLGSGEARLRNHRSESDIRAAKVYGAQQRNLIIDARPIINARVNQAAGMGSENMDYYKDATITFLGIENIHVMRDSLGKVIEALQNSDYTSLPPDQEMLAKSKWLRYIGLILKGSDIVARQIGINHSHVLIHCSDGWDRTSQISAISQLCLDPYYRTLEGFITLVEKDWLSFGHQFRRRTGPLGSEKWFDIENERVSGRRTENGSNHMHSSNAFENALSSARGFFSKKNESRDAFDSDADAPGSVEGSPSHARSTPSKDDKHATRVNETSPIFHQFLDATWQLLYQHPTRFEFNERFLRRLLYQLYACQYGTFLYDNERERVEADVMQRTRSVWDYFLARKEQFINNDYQPEIDDNVKGQERLIFPDTTKVRWWPEIFGRTDEEMNGTANAPAVSLPREDEPVVTGIESSDVAVGPAANGSLQSLASENAFMASAERLSSSLSGLGFGRTSAPGSRPMTPPVSARKDAVREGNSAGLGNEMGRDDISFSTFARDSAFRDA